ncbi:integrase core domain-containing protein [Streptomyces milbemycinicus]|uniref:Integrase core domain-containing protein n=1 Tax=Streptomyces milbemycinicus TaxID=476552 RepID=A0ABW8LZN0_9ACTN
MNSVIERWVQTCMRELLDRTLIWNQRHLLHALREFEQFYNAHRPHQGIANARPLHPSPAPITDPDQIASLDVRRTNASAAASTNTDMPHDLHGWDFRQAQGAPRNTPQALAAVSGQSGQRSRKAANARRWRRSSAMTAVRA